MKEEEKKEELPVEGTSKTGIDFGQVDGNGGTHKPAEGGEKDEDDDKDKDPLPGHGTTGPEK